MDTPGGPLEWWGGWCLGSYNKKRHSNNYFCHTVWVVALSQLFYQTLNFSTVITDGGLCTGWANSDFMLSFHKGESCVSEQLCMSITTYFCEFSRCANQWITVCHLQWRITMSCCDALPWWVSFDWSVYYKSFIVTKVVGSYVILPEKPLLDLIDICKPS